MSLTARKLIVHSVTAKALLHNSYPYIPKNKVVVIPLGCELKTPPAITKIIKLKKVWGIPADSIVLLSLGYLRKSKGILELLEAFRMVRNEHLLLYIVGKVIDDKIATELHKNKDKRIIHLGFVSNAELDDLLQLSDALVSFRLDSVGESSAAILDMFSYGKPILASDIGSNLEVIDKAGLVVNPDVQSIKDAITQFSNDMEFRLTLNRSVIPIRKKYEIGQVAKEYLKLFNLK